MKYLLTALLLPLVMLAACDTQQDPAAPATRTPADQGAGTTQTQRAAPTTPGAGMQAFAEIMPTEGNDVRGVVRLAAINGTVRLTGSLTGLEPGVHGFHIHEVGDCSAPDASSAGGHYNPHSAPHGSPQAPNDGRHVGDLGNITANAEGVAGIDVEDTQVKLSGPESVIGKPVVVHSGEDDFQSQPSGDAGSRVGCGIIVEGIAGATG